MMKLTKRRIALAAAAFSAVLIPAAAYAAGFCPLCP